MLVFTFTGCTVISASLHPSYGSFQEDVNEENDLVMYSTKHDSYIFTFGEDMYIELYVNPRTQEVYKKVLYMPIYYEASIREYLIEEEGFVEKGEKLYTQWEVITFRERARFNTVTMTTVQRRTSDK